MADEFPIRSKLLKGAFVEYGFSIPPILFAFQFNPETLRRSRSVSERPGGAGGSASGEGCRDHDESQERSLLSELSVSPETIGLSLQLDAVDELDAGEGLAQAFGVGPRLAALELMIYPKTDQLFGFPIGNLLGGNDQFGAAQAPTIPILLFIWGRKRVMPVIMTSMTINEQEFFPDLNPKRAQIEVQLRVLEGLNPPYLYSHGLRMAQSLLNLANIGELGSVLF